MARRAAPHPDSEKPFIGSPRGLPQVLLCNAHQHKVCGRRWIVNRADQYEPAVKAREIHEALCAAPELAKQMSLHLGKR